MIIIDERKIKSEIDKEIMKIDKEKLITVNVEELTKKIIDAVLDTFEPEESEG